MIPLRDENPYTGFAYVVLLIILANVFVFIYQAFMGPENFDHYVLAYGLIPAELVGRVETILPGRVGLPFMSVFSSMFMHGGFFHLIFNMWFLWIFGDNVEIRLGHFRFILFYLATGVAAVLAHTIMDPSSTIPLVGASGAIAGVLGAYFLLFPRHRILTLIPIFIFITTVRIPAALFLGLWFLMQLLYSSMGGQVAWWAHIGGFIAGFLLVSFFLPRHQKA